MSQLSSPYFLKPGTQSSPVEVEAAGPTQKVSTPAPESAGYMDFTVRFIFTRCLGSGVP